MGINCFLLALISLNYYVPLSLSKDGAETCGAESLHFPLGVCSSVPNLAMIGKRVYTGDPQLSKVVQIYVVTCGYVKLDSFFGPSSVRNPSPIELGMVIEDLLHFQKRLLIQHLVLPLWGAEKLG